MSREPDIVIAPQPGPQTEFLKSSADIAIIGGQAGGGKSRAIVMDPIRHKDVPGFDAAIFRRTMPEITRPGGLWSESMKIYPHAGAASIRSPHQHTFASGASVSMYSLQYEDDMYGWASSALACIGFDELTTFLESQFWYLQSRNRSTCGVIPYTRGSCNPDADSFVAGLVEWYIDQETGFAIPERSGIKRYFLRVNEEIVWGKTRRELQKRYPDQKRNVRSFTFIPAKLSDNPALERADPGYRARLMSLQEVDRERLLRGNWKIRFSKGMLFKHHYFPIYSGFLSPFLPRVRFWDEASVEDGGDFSSGVLLAYDPQTDTVFVEDVQRGQWDVPQREQVMERTLKADTAKYPHLHTVWETQPGAAGRTQTWFRSERLKKHSKRHQLHTQKPSGSKVERAKPASIYAERGHRKDLVLPIAFYLMPGPWNQVFADNLTAFPTKGVPDDDVDALSGAHNWLLLNYQKIAQGL